MKKCEQCGRESPDDFIFCPSCGSSLSVFLEPVRPLPSRHKPVKLAFQGGILVLVGGILGLGFGAFMTYLFLGYYLFDHYPYYGFFWFFPFALLGPIGIVTSILAIVGGVFAIKRTNFALALVGSVFCLISIGPLGVSFLLGLIGLIFIATSRDEFM